MADRRRTPICRFMNDQKPAPSPAPEPVTPPPDPAGLPTEVGGAPGPEPTRYGDWQHKGRVTDF